jgi:hypothetical protein
LPLPEGQTGDACEPSKNNHLFEKLEGLRENHFHRVSGFKVKNTGNLG